jgi:dinuclear metal center YbgI/SA1388 family protein
MMRVRRDDRMLRKDLESYLADYLGVKAFDDEAVNGLQVEGRAEIHRVVVAVSACAEVFQKALACRADAVLVHHGLFWRGHGPEPVVGVLKERLALLLKADVSLFAYHLPLDAHQEVGNNAVAARDLGLLDLVPFGEYHSMAIGWKGRLPEPLPTAAFVEKLERYYGHPALVVPGGPAEVSTVGLVSGGAAKEAAQAAAQGLDAYVTGEPSEPMTYYCKEAGLTFAALGHYATERVGVRALAKHIEARWSIETRFVEVENEA